MAYPTHFVRLSFGGTLADGQEIWSCGLSIASPEMAGDPMAFPGTFTPLMTALGNEITGFVEDARTLVPEGVKLEWMKLAHLGTDGKYTQEPLEQQLTAEGGGNDNYLPQAAIVCTLQSDVWKDPGKYNRFFMPVTIVGDANAYMLSTSRQNAYAAALKEFIDGLNDVLYNEDVAKNAFVAVSSNTGNGRLSPVVAVRLGRIVDTQRRRRNQLTESYVTVEIDTAPPAP